MEISQILSLYPLFFTVIASVLGVFLVLWIFTYAMDFLKAFDTASRIDGSSAMMEDPNSLTKVSNDKGYYWCAVFDVELFFLQASFPSIFDPSEKYLSLIIPAYNEESRMPGALDEMLIYLQKRSIADKSFTYEVLIVDDGSTDGTTKVAYERIKKFSVDKVRIIPLGVNCGKGAAIKKGMIHSRGELLLMLDADGATKVSDLEKLEAKVLDIAGKEIAKRGTSSKSTVKNIGDIPVVVFGSRAHLERLALATRKWYRNLLMKGFHLCVLLVAGPGVKDTQCGFKMFTRSAARQLFKNVRLTRWCFDVEIVYLCKVLSIPIYEISVNWTEIPGSKVGITSIMHMVLEMACIRLGYGLCIWKIYK